MQVVFSYLGRKDLKFAKITSMKQRKLIDRIEDSAAVDKEPFFISQAIKDDFYFLVSVSSINFVRTATDVATRTL
jgi:hypothetical protein